MRLVTVKRVKTSKLVLETGARPPKAYSKDIKDMTPEERIEVLKYLESNSVRPTLTLRKKA